MADPLQDSIVDTLKASSAELFNELLSLTQAGPEELLAKLAKAHNDEKLKVETSSHLEAFANLCLEVVVLGVTEVTERLLKKHQVEPDSPYLLLLYKCDDDEDDVGACYVFPEGQQLEYFASRGAVNFLASQKTSEAQKKGVLLALTSNPQMRKVVELTFEMIAADRQQAGYLQDILRATLILQHPAGHRPMDDVTRRLFGLPERVTELNLSNLLSGGVQESEVQLIEDIWGEINAAFDVHAEGLQSSGWFVRLHVSVDDFSADGCDLTIRDSPVLHHILRCLELLHGDKMAALCSTTTHLLLPSYRQIDEADFIAAYRVSDHSWALTFTTATHLCLQAVYPEDMPTALEECSLGDHQSINLDFRTQNVNLESYCENLKLSVERCWLSLNQENLTTNTVKSLTLRVNGDTILHGLIDRLSLVDNNNHYSITFKGGVLHLRELKDCLTRHKMLQFQKTTIKIPDELNKGFVQRDLYKSYPNMIKCLKFLHETEKMFDSQEPHDKGSLGHLVPPRNVSSGISRKSEKYQDLSDDKFDKLYERIAEKLASLSDSLEPDLTSTESSTLPLKPRPRPTTSFMKPRPRAPASSMMEGAVRDKTHPQASSEKTPENDTTPLKPQLKPSSTMQGVSPAQQGQTLIPDLVSDEDDADSDFQSDNLRMYGGHIQVESGGITLEDDDLRFNLEPEKGDTDIPIDISGEVKWLRQISELIEKQDEVTAHMTEPDLTSHIGRSLRKVGDACGKDALWYQNTGVRISYTLTVAVLTWGAVSNCVHLDIVPGLLLNRKLTIFNSR